LLIKPIIIPPKANKIPSPPKAPAKSDKIPTPLDAKAKILSGSVLTSPSISESFLKSNKNSL
jgi:hypothetical protein